MNGWESFVADAQSVELMQPCDGAFNHPARRAQPAVVERESPHFLLTRKMELSGHSELLYWGNATNDHVGRS